MTDFIEVRGAGEHNLKNISVRIPKNKLVALTGPSGSGKSTFAMDILQRECQRQYMESMGMVTDGMNKPGVDEIIGLSPSISVRQGNNTKNPRSTVGTLTEILTYLRVLYAKFGERLCPGCGEILRPSFSMDRFSSEESGSVICPSCGLKMKSLSMADFSFNKAEGFCETCSGLGVMNELDLSSFIDENLSLTEGAVAIWKGIIAEHYAKTMENAGKHYGFDCDASKKIKEFSDMERLVFYHGVGCPEFKALFPDIPEPKRVCDGKVEGIYTYMKKKAAEDIRKGTGNQKIASCFRSVTCPDCGGSRLKRSSREVEIDGKSIVEVSGMTLYELNGWIEKLKEKIDPAGRKVFDVIGGDILRRLRPVMEIGLSYLSLDRSMATLSGGEAQRLRLARLTDSGLTGVLYVLDEPTSGLHPGDTEKILNALGRLRDLGNTVLVIEHDMDFVACCDHIIEFGPGAGESGGRITAEGSPSELMDNRESLTGRFLNRKRGVKNSGFTVKDSLSIRGARLHNLKNIDVSIPLNAFVSVTGVSGSGKSSLILDLLGNVSEHKNTVDVIEGLDNINRIIEVDQKGIGRSSRSNVATYTDVFTLIRNLFAADPEARKLKLQSRDFSFNVKGGRCENCQGLGSIALDMHFLEDMEVECPVCHGKRFHSQTLSVKYRGLSISDILDRTVEENLEIFRDHKELVRKLAVLNDVGLGYLTLGQPTSTLSGGECQRIKLSRELGRADRGATLYLLDEPTSGLHPNDSERLVTLLEKLVSRGHSVIVIEHSMDLVARSDWVIDLGPGGGSRGGLVVAQGTPEQIRESTGNITGRYL